MRLGGLNGAWGGGCVAHETDTARSKTRQTEPSFCLHPLGGAGFATTTLQKPIFINEKLSTIYIIFIVAARRGANTALGVASLTFRRQLPSFPAVAEQVLQFDAG
jgi:hypothetical protein